MQAIQGANWMDSFFNYKDKRETRATPQQRGAFSRARVVSFFVQILPRGILLRDSLSRYVVEDLSSSRRLL
jgi:hypothetical protein